MSGASSTGVSGSFQPADKINSENEASNQSIHWNKHAAKRHPTFLLQREVLRKRACGVFPNEGAFGFSLPCFAPLTHHEPTDTCEGNKNLI